MARPKKGWRLRFRPGRAAEVRFTHNGINENIGLGTSDPEEAARKAEQVYVSYVTGKQPPKPKGVKQSENSSKTFDEASAEWLVSMKGVLRERTLKVYEAYCDRLGQYFNTLSDCTTDAASQYISSRLGVVMAKTVHKELSVYRSILVYSHGKKWIDKIPDIPTVPKKAKGTRYSVRRRCAAPSFTDEEIEALLAALPEWSTSKKKSVTPFPVRARFIVGYDQAIRPELLNLLEVPTHWSRDRPSLWVPTEHDKTGAQREIPLTKRSLEALDAVAPKTGLIFGDHDYRDLLKAAAKRALPDYKAKIFCAQHLRSAGLTVLAEISPAGAQMIAGHKYLSTTSIYVRAREKEASKVIEMIDKRRSGG